MKRAIPNPYISKFVNTHYGVPTNFTPIPPTADEAIIEQADNEGRSLIQQTQNRVKLSGKYTGNMIGKR